MKVRVRNFQSIKDATIEVKGFTVVTGTNNSGKSALVRALRGAFQNSKGSSFVRHGEATAKVDIDFDDGKNLYWEKGKDTKPTYCVNKGTLLHPGQGVPVEVEALGVVPITAGGKELWPQFAPQFTGQVFLLDQPGSVLAEAVADVERVSQLNEALRISESDRRAANSELRVRRADLVRLTKKLERFDGLDDIQRQIEALEQTRKKGETLQRALETLVSLRDRLVGAEGTVASLQGIEDIPLPQDESFILAGKLIKGKETIEGFRDRLRRAEARIEKLVGISEVSTEFDFTGVEGVLRGLSETEALNQRWEAANKKVTDEEALLATEVENLTSATDELQQVLGGYSECPLCGKAMCHEHSEESC